MITSTVQTAGKIYQKTKAMMATAVDILDWPFKSVVKLSKLKLISVLSLMEIFPD